MTNKYAWHYVNPLNEEPVYSIMVSGLPWESIEFSKSKSSSLATLNDRIFSELFQIFVKLVDSVVSVKV